MKISNFSGNDTNKLATIQENGVFVENFKNERISRTGEFLNYLEQQGCSFEDFQMHLSRRLNCAFGNFNQFPKNDPFYSVLCVSMIALRKLETLFENSKENPEELSFKDIRQCGEVLAKDGKDGGEHVVSIVKSVVTDVNGCTNDQARIEQADLLQNAFKRADKVLEYGSAQGCLKKVVLEMKKNLFRQVNEIM